MKATRSPLYRKLMGTKLGKKMYKEFILNEETVELREYCTKCSKAITQFNRRLVGGCDSCTFTAI